LAICDATYTLISIAIGWAIALVGLVGALDWGELHTSHMTLSCQAAGRLVLAHHKRSAWETNRLFDHHHQPRPFARRVKITMTANALTAIGPSATASNIHGMRIDNLLCRYAMRISASFAAEHGFLAD
jgi:hypothetical protein